MSRGEFLAMCMELSGRELLSGVRSTGFADDGAIPAWLKPYVSTALLDNVISGYVQAGGAVFDAAAPVSRAEAAVILSRALDLTELTPAGGISQDAAPVWAPAGHGESPGPGPHGNLPFPGGQPHPGRMRPDAPGGPWIIRHRLFEWTKNTAEASASAVFLLCLLRSPNGGPDPRPGRRTRSGSPCRSRRRGGRPWAFSRCAPGCSPPGYGRPGGLGKPDG